MNIRRVYETTIIINSSLEEADIEMSVNKIISFIENHGGVVEETNKWGNRRLAYTIRKKHHGYYVHIVFNIHPNEVPTLERFLTLDDTILRHLTLLLEPELREYRKKKSLAEGKSGETIISSVVEVEKISTTYIDKSTLVITGEETAEEIIIDEVQINEVPNEEETTTE